MTTVIETCRIPPPQGVAAELLLPLSFFDMSWLHTVPMYVLNLYNHPCSEAEFLNTIVPNLKHSLSLTLKHYLPVAGNLLFPLDTDTDTSKPILCYISGDTVALTVAVSGLDFDELVANHAREADQFYDLVPPPVPLTEDENYKIAPVFSFQATLFPGRGICIGVNFQHTLCDWRSTVGFVKAWAMINKFGGDEVLVSKTGPVFEKPDSEGSRRVDGMYWNEMKKIPFEPAASLPRPTNRVRASFVLRQSDIRKLKNRILSARPGLDRVSTLMVAAAYVWTTLVKSHGSSAEGEEEVLYIPADARGRRNALFDPPVPVNYFGNCLGGGLVKMEQRKLAGEDGFVVAAEAIGDVIKTKILDGDELLKRPEDRLGKMERREKVFGVLVVYGSPKFEYKEADFGWGVARKVMILSLDQDNYGMLMSNSGDGGLVIDMSLPKERMESFASIFQDGLILRGKVYGESRM